MREHGVFALFLLLGPAAFAQTVPSGWKMIRDAKTTCQLAVPPEWNAYSQSGGSAIFSDPSTAIAIVTAQPGQEFKPLTPSMIKTMGIPKEMIFENSNTRVFYQDRVSEGAHDQNGYSASAPGRGGTCSCRVVFLPSVGAETARKIVLTLGPVPDNTARVNP